MFGRGKISSLMGDVAKGIKSFKKEWFDVTDQSEQKVFPTIIWNQTPLTTKNKPHAYYWLV